MSASTRPDDRTSSASHLLILVERAEDLRAQLANDAATARAAAETFGEHSTSNVHEADLSSCCRLVHWALTQASNSLDKLTTIAGEGEPITLNRYLAICEEHRNLVLWAEASVNLIRQHAVPPGDNSEIYQEVGASLGALGQSLGFSAVALATLKRAAGQAPASTEES